MFSIFKNKENSAEENQTLVLKAYLPGKVIPIEEVKDEVISSKALGDGLAIEPEGNIVTAPCAATVSLLMGDSKHAVGLTLSNGAELLIHEGQKVKAGDKLLEFDPEKIKAQGYEKTCILVFTNGDEYPDMKIHTGMDAVQNETVIVEF